MQANNTTHLNKLLERPANNIQWLTTTNDNTRWMSVIASVTGHGARRRRLHIVFKFGLMFVDHNMRMNASIQPIAGLH